MYLIGNILENMRARNKLFIENLEAINIYMKNEHVTNELRLRISNYLEYMHEHEDEI